MTEVLMNKLHLVGTGYAELPQDGRRYRFHIERYRHDDGTEFGRIVSMEEIPDVGEYLWIPSYGLDADEVEHMTDEYRWEQANPTDAKLEHDGKRRAERDRKYQWYRDACDMRMAEAHGNQRQFLAR